LPGLAFRIPNKNFNRQGVALQRPLSIPTQHRSGIAGTNVRLLKAEAAN
jgi:hypothetical protein